MNRKRFLPMLTAFYLLAALFCTPALAVGSVADAVEQTWGDASEQIKAVVDSVVFPALSMVLAIAFFVKLALTYFEYRKHGQFEWTGPAILFVCLIFVLLAPNYIWGIIGDKENGNAERGIFGEGPDTEDGYEPGRAGTPGK